MFSETQLLCRMRARLSDRGRSTSRNHSVISHSPTVADNYFSQHMEYASVHRDDSDDDDSPEFDVESDDNHPDGWEDGLGAVLFPEGGSDEELPSTATEYAIERASDDEGLALETLLHDLSDEFSDLEQVSLEAEPDPSGSEIDADVQDAENSVPATNLTTSESLSEVIYTGPASPEPTRTISVHSFTCPLCLDFPTASSATRCGHVFCRRYVVLPTDLTCATPD